MRTTASPRIYSSSPFFALLVFALLAGPPLPIENSFGRVLRFLGDSDHWMPLVALFLALIAMAQVLSLARRRRAELIQRADELAKLHRLWSAMMQSKNFQSARDQVTESVVKVFGVEGAALYDTTERRIFRAGPKSWLIDEGKLRHSAGDGTRFTDEASHVSIVPIRSDGRLNGSLALASPAVSDSLMEDLAERIGIALSKLNAIEKETQAEVARRSQELRSAVLDALVHEIKSPLNSIKIAASTLLSPQHVSDEQERDLLMLIRTETDRLNDSLDDAVRMVRIETGDPALDLELHQAHRMVNDVLKQMEANVRGRPMQIDIPQSLPLAECDGKMVKRVLSVLLDNAVKYSPPGSSLAVSAECSGKQIVFTVLNHGPVLAEGERERIFEKYYRGQASAGVAGTGLGLASAKCIVEAHGGMIWATSQPGSGTGFHFSLPAHESVFQ